jgi:hypothetical protein
MDETRGIFADLPIQRTQQAPDLLSFQRIGQSCNDCGSQYPSSAYQHPGPYLSGTQRKPRLLLAKIYDGHKYVERVRRRLKRRHDRGCWLHMGRVKYVKHYTAHCQQTEQPQASQPSAITITNGQIQHPVPHLAQKVELSTTAPLFGNTYQSGRFDTACPTVGRSELIVNTWNIAALVECQPSEPGPNVDGVVFQTVVEKATDSQPCWPRVCIVIEVAYLGVCEVNFAIRANFRLQIQGCRAQSLQIDGETTWVCESRATQVQPSGYACPEQFDFAAHGKAANARHIPAYGKPKSRQGASAWVYELSIVKNKRTVDLGVSKIHLTMCDEATRAHHCSINGEPGREQCRSIRVVQDARAESKRTTDMRSKKADLAMRDKAAITEHRPIHFKPGGLKCVSLRIRQMCIAKIEGATDMGANQTNLAASNEPFIECKIAANDQLFRHDARYIAARKTYRERGRLVEVDRLVEVTILQNQGTQKRCGCQIEWACNESAAQLRSLQRSAVWRSHPSDQIDQQFGSNRSSTRPVDRLGWIIQIWITDPQVDQCSCCYSVNQSFLCLRQRLIGQHDAPSAPAIRQRDLRGSQQQSSQLRCAGSPRRVAAPKGTIFLFWLSALPQSSTTRSTGSPTSLSGSEHMMEAHVLARTGATVRVHQHRTVANYLRLRDLAPELPIIPVLEGQSIADYNRCADFYERHDIDLAALPLVGVGSVCRGQHTAEVEQIMRSLSARGYRLHAFGAKVLGLGRYADAISSSDSAAWSFRVRYVPGCTPSHRSESNCLRFALAWHTRLLTSLRAEELGHKPDCGLTSARGKGPRGRGQRNGRSGPASPRPRQAQGRMAARARNSPAA